MKRIQHWGLTALAGAMVAFASIATAGPGNALSIKNEELRLSADGHPDARVSRAGRLFIDDIEVPTSAGQRQALVRMHAYVEEIGAQGQAIGREAQELAAEAVDEAMQAVADGRAHDPGFAAGIEASVKARVAASLQGICGSVDSLVESSQHAIDLGLIELLPYLEDHLEAGAECWAEVANLH